MLNDNNEVEKGLKLGIFFKFQDKVKIISKLETIA